MSEVEKVVDTWVRSYIETYIDADPVCRELIYAWIKERDDRLAALEGALRAMENDYFEHEYNCWELLLEGADSDTIMDAAVSIAERNILDVRRRFGLPMRDFTYGDLGYSADDKSAKHPVSRRDLVECIAKLKAQVEAPEAETSVEVALLEERITAMSESEAFQITALKEEVEELKKHNSTFSLENERLHYEILAANGRLAQIEADRTNGIEPGMRECAEVMDRLLAPTPESRQAPTLGICAHCGEPTGDNSSMYCGQRCRSAADAKRAEKRPDSDQRKRDARLARTAERRKPGGDLEARPCRFCQTVFEPIVPRQQLCTPVCMRAEAKAKYEASRLPAAPEFATTKCARCEKLFERETPNQRYCSDDCALHAREEKKRERREAQTPVVSKEFKPKPCAECGKDFDPRGALDMCCSDECRENRRTKTLFVGPYVPPVEKTGSLMDGKSMTTAAFESKYVKESEEALSDRMRAILGVVEPSPAVGSTKAIQCVRMLEGGATVESVGESLFLGAVSAKSVCEWARRHADDLKILRAFEQREYLRLLLVALGPEKAPGRKHA